MRMHIHPKQTDELRQTFSNLGTKVKTTDKPAGKWIELGLHQVIADERGKIIASIFVGAATQPKMPIVAMVGNKEIGKFISASTARAAVEKSMLGFDDEHGAILNSIIERFQKIREAAA